MAKEMEEKESKRTREREGGDKEGKGEHESKREREGEKKGGEKGRKHLHEIRTTQAEDGTYTHHHTFKKKKEDHFTEPERGPMATSSTPEEAGQHVAEQFGQNQMGGEEQGAGEPEAGGEPEAEPQPGA